MSFGTANDGTTKRWNENLSSTSDPLRAIRVNAFIELRALTGRIHSPSCQVTSQVQFRLEARPGQYYRQ